MIAVFDPTESPPRIPPSPPADVLQELDAMLRSLTLAGVRVEVRVIPILTSVSPVATVQHGERSLTPAMRDIVALLSKDKPSKCEWLACKLGKKSGGSFRSLCADLVRLGVARHVKAVGYFLV